MPAPGGRHSALSCVAVTALACCPHSARCAPLIRQGRALHSPTARVRTDNPEDRNRSLKLEGHVGNGLIFLLVSAFF